MIFDPLHRSFDLIADANTRLLVLGSLPGRRSLAERRYYAHPSNQFWRLLSPAAGADLASLRYAGRLEALRAAGIGLWDVVGRARRQGSLDSAIRDAEPRDLLGVVEALPALRALAFNGGAAYRIGVGQFGGRPPVELVPLPSSSSAHAVGIEAKQAAWSRLAAYL